MGSFCSSSKKRRYGDNPLQTLLRTRNINTLLDMWPESYFNMIKQKYWAVKPLDGMDHQKFRNLFPNLKSQSKILMLETSMHVFQCFDFDQNGRIDFHELCKMLSLIFNSEECDRADILFTFYDFDYDRKLSCEEFNYFLSENKQYLYNENEFERNNSEMSQDMFKVWLGEHFNLTRYFEIFELLPGPLRERERIREILSGKNNSKKFYVISYKWWELWRFYVNYNYVKNPKKKKGHQISILDVNIEEFEEPKINTPQQQDDQGVQGSQSEFRYEEQINPQLDFSHGHGLCESVHESQYLIDNQPTIRPGPIDNSDLQGEYEGELRTNILNNHDYLTIQEQAWLSLVQWYGCSNNLSYKRRLQEDLRTGTYFIDLYPPMFQGYITQRNGEISFKKVFKFLIGSRKTMQSVKEKLVKKFKVKDFYNYNLFFMKVNEQWKQVEDLDQTILDLEITSGTFVALVPIGKKPISEFQQLLCGLGQFRDVQHPLSNDWLLCIIRGFSEDLSSIQFHIPKENYSRDFSISVQERAQRIFPPNCKQKQEQIQTQIISHPGLQNLGNTCFINTVLQCLINTPLFDDYLRRQAFKQDLQKNIKATLLIEELSKVAIRLQDHKDRAFPPDQFKKTIDLNLPSFSGFEQHDAQEFLNILLDKISEELIKFNLKKQLNSSNMNNSFIEQQENVIKELFTGKLVNTLICQHCNYKSQKTEDYFTLSLPIPLNDDIPIFLVVFRKAYSFQNSNPPPLIKYGLKISKYAFLKDLISAIERLTGISQSKFEITEIYRNQIHRFFGKLNPQTPIRQIGLKANQQLVLFEIQRVQRDAEDEFQELIQYFSYRKDHFQKDDYIDIEEWNGEWRHGQIVNIQERQNEKSYRVLIRKQLNSQSSYINCHQFQLQPFRSKVNTRKTFSQVTVINRYYNKVTDQFETFSSPFILLVPTNHLTLQELQLLIYIQAKRFIDFDYLKKKRSLAKMQKENKQDVSQEMQNDLFFSKKNQNVQSVYLGEAAKSKDNFRKTEQDLEDIHNKNRHSGYQSIQDELNFLKQGDFPYRVRILDAQNYNCLICEKSTTTMYNKLNHCNGCEIDPIFMFLPQNYCIALDWIDSLAFNPHSVVNIELHESYSQLTDSITNKKDRVTPEQCFQLLTQEDKIEINCDKCQSKQQATVKLQLGPTPIFFVLHLKRFQYRDGYLEKIESDINFPLKNLNLKQWSTDPQNNNKIYDLYAVANHFGNGQYGHYTAYVQKVIDKKEKWLHCDDDQVKYQADDRVMSPYSYLLFYRRREIPTSTLLKFTYKN